MLKIKKKLNLSRDVRAYCFEFLSQFSKTFRLIFCIIQVKNIIKKVRACRYNPKNSATTITGFVDIPRGNLNKLHFIKACIIYSHN